MPITPAEQLAAALRDDIHTGRLAVGDELPRDRELVELYQISHSTVARAIRILRDEGLIASRVGSSRSVIDHPARYRAHGMRLAPAPGSASSATEPADRPTARGLGISEGDPVQVTTWTEVAENGLPAVLRTTRTAAEQAVDTSVTTSEEVVTARLATASEATRLQLDQTIPVLVTRRISHGADRRVIQDTVAASHRVELLYELP